MKGLYKALTGAARRYDKHNVDGTYHRSDMIAFIYDLPSNEVLEMVYEAIEILDEIKAEYGNN